MNENELSIDVGLTECTITVFAESQPLARIDLHQIDLVGQWDMLKALARHYRPETAFLDRTGVGLALYELITTAGDDLAEIVRLTEE